jgi:hypothetical protein
MQFIIHFLPNNKSFTVKNRLNGGSKFEQTVLRLLSNLYKLNNDNVWDDFDEISGGVGTTWRVLTGSSLDNKASMFAKLK